MKILRIVFLLNFLGFLLLLACNREKHEDIEPGVQESRALHFYNLGLDTKDPEEKLKLYERGLEAVEDVEDTVLASLLEGKVYALSILGKFEESRKWIDSLIEIAKIQKDTFYIAKGYYRKSRLFAIEHKPDLEFENAFIARQYNLLSGDSSMAARRSLDMASAQFEMGDFTGCQESAAEALKYLDRTKDSIYLSAAHNIVGLAYMNRDLNQDAIAEFNNAMQYAAREKDSLTFLHNIALAYKNEEKYEKALDILESIVQSDAPDVHSKSRFLDNLAFTRWLKDSTAQVDSLFLEALRLREESDDLEGLQTSYSHLAQYYENKDREQAIIYARKSLEAARDNSASGLEASSLKKLISLVDGPEEKKYVDRYIFLQDSLDQASAKAKFHFAKVRYDENRKQEQISDLEKENFQSTLETERLQKRNVVSLLSILMLLLIGAVLIFYFLQRSRKEKLRQIYLTERRISKRIHDELANDVYNLMRTIENTVPKEAVDRLHHIYRRTRDISRENADIDTGAGFGSGMVSMLSQNAGASRLVLRGENKVAWEKISEEKKVAIYRILQELMVNMRKHSKAQFTAINFVDLKKKLEINYSDTGVGADPDEIYRGNGLQNVKTRLQSIHGSISFETQKDKGFKAQIIIPK